MVSNGNRLEALREAFSKRIVVLASKEHHCLGDILIRQAFGELNAQVLGVISNHKVLEPLVTKFNLPFHHISPRDLFLMLSSHVQIDH